MSKASRRQQRTGSSTQPSPTSPSAQPSKTAATSERSPSYSATGTARAGRRAHPRHRAAAPQSFVERYRTVLVAAVVFAAVALVGAFVFTSASAAAFTCTTVWTPSPTPSPAAGASHAPGYVQPDMGRRHVEYGTNVTYQYCAPASGSHYNKAGSGPIQPRLYGPSDTVIPQGWIHNLEHGAVVVAYRCPSGVLGQGDCISQAEFSQLQQWFDNAPPNEVAARVNSWGLC